MIQYKIVLATASDVILSGDMSEKYNTAMNSMESRVLAFSQVSQKTRTTLLGSIRVHPTVRNFNAFAIATAGQCFGELHATADL